MSRRGAWQGTHGGCGAGVQRSQNGTRRWLRVWKTRLSGSESRIQIVQGPSLHRVRVELPKNGNWRLQRAEHCVAGSERAPWDGLSVLPLEPLSRERQLRVQRGGSKPENHPFRSQFQVCVLNLRGNTKVGLMPDQGALRTCGSRLGTILAPVAYRSAYLACNTRF